MVGYGRDVQRINLGLGKKYGPSHDRGCNWRNFWGRWQYRNAVNGCNSLGRQDRVACGDFIEDILGNDEFVARSFVHPPPRCKQLAGGIDEVSTRLLP